MSSDFEDKMVTLSNLNTVFCEFAWIESSSHSQNRDISALTENLAPIKHFFFFLLLLLFL